jgi:hypothetical protein
VGTITGFVDIHSHVVPSGDDGARSVEAGLGLCLEAARRGTTVLYATPHVWPSLRLGDDRERAVRAAHAEMAPVVADHGLDLRLGWELTPSEQLLEEDPGRYRLGQLPAVLMEVPSTALSGSLSASASTSRPPVSPRSSRTPSVRRASARSSRSSPPSASEAGSSR